MSFLNEVKNLHNIVRKGIRDSSLSLRMTLPGLFTKPSYLPFDIYFYIKHHFVSCSVGVPAEVP